MTNYVLTFPAGGDMPDDPAAIAQMMAAWNAWFGSLGDALVDGGAPFGRAVTLHGDGSSTEGATPLGGYSVVRADDLDAALAIAKGCPIHQGGAPIGVHEAIAM